MEPKDSGIGYGVVSVIVATGKGNVEEKLALRWMMDVGGPFGESADDGLFPSSNRTPPGTR